MIKEIHFPDPARRPFLVSQYPSGWEFRDPATLLYSQHFKRSASAFFRERVLDDLKADCRRRVQHFERESRQIVPLFQDTRHSGEREKGWRERKLLSSLQEEGLRGGHFSRNRWGGKRGFVLANFRTHWLHPSGSGCMRFSAEWEESKEGAGEGLRINKWKFSPNSAREWVLGKCGRKKMLCVCVRHVALGQKSIHDRLIRLGALLCRWAWLFLVVTGGRRKRVILNFRLETAEFSHHPHKWVVENLRSRNFWQYSKQVLEFSEY